jgi:protein-S-isoprenylcysteine O-methyltransferase Ste14
MQADDDKRGPGLRFPPPLLPLGLIFAAWLLQQWVPLAISGDAQLRWPGILLVAMAVLLAVIALMHFRRAKTAIEPWHPTTTIIQYGIYRYSRNPIYLAFCIATIGAALIINSWWGLIAVAPLVYLLQLLVIRKEETYLEARFADTYLDYKRRVRRWL